MPSDELKPGDVVRLASGGPEMTVEGEGTLTGTLFCQWFDTEGKLSGEQFVPAMLVKVNGGKKSESK
jgi:uncharacterized protein YodC (DUF2158 family)